MDIALCIIDRKRMTLQYAGAHHPLYLVRKGELQVIKGDPMPIGISLGEDRPFTNHDLLTIKIAACLTNLPNGSRHWMNGRG